MVGTLLNHEWKSFWRARNARVQLVIQILIGIFILYFLLLAIAGAFLLAEGLGKIFPNQDVVSVFCGFILYYFAVDLFLRLQLQELPTLIVQPYLIQNIRRVQLVAFLNLRSLFSIFNLLPLILVIPFLIVRVLPAYGGIAALALFITVISLSIFNHFLIMLVNRKALVSSLWTITFLGVLVGLGAADYYHLFSVRAVSAFLFMPVVRYPFFCLLAIALATAGFYTNRLFLLRNLYLEEIVTTAQQRTSSNYSWLNRFGQVGELLGMDIKLILRNKRLRTMLGTSALFLFYGFFFFKTSTIEKGRLSVLLLGSVYVTGMTIVQFSVLIFSSQCSFFDGLMSTNLSIHTYIKAKLTLLSLLSTLALLPALFYGLLSWKMIPILVSAYFFNVGISSIIYIYSATFNHKAVDINKATAIFSQKGFNITQMIFPLLIVLIGMAAYVPVAFLINPWAGVLTVGLIGLISLLLRERWINIITRQFLRQKYKMLEGFREK